MELEMFEKLFKTDDSDEFLKFERIEAPLSTRKDIHAFILLNMLVPDTCHILGNASHDEVWLDVDVEKLISVVTKEQVIDLIRCGVRYDSENESLAMFV